MVEQTIIDGSWLPYSFAFLMCLSMLIYGVLDGYDLGVGMLIENANWHEKDRMIASIGPFWDANETWLILGIGLLLVAFPMAHGIILTNLYLPVAVMLFGLIFRGVAFDFRAKVPYQQKWRWNNNFFYGSLLMSLGQGYMLGSYIIGFDKSLAGVTFSSLIAVVLCSAYCLVGACWLIMKTDNTLQEKSAKWAKYHLVNSVVGLIAIYAVTPLMNTHVLEKLSSFPEAIYYVLIALFTVALIIWLYRLLRKMPMLNDRYCWLPFAITVAIYLFSFIGLAYSFFPYIVPNKMTLLEAAAAPESLIIMLFGALLVLPILIAYTVFAYYIFRGKATELSYD